MLKKVDYIEDLLLNESFNQFNDLRLTYYASEIMEKLGCEEEEEMTHSMDRVFQVCQSINLPVQSNFRRIYRYDGNKLSIDWKVSPLGCYLLMINGNPCNPNVARAQVFFAARKSEAD
ncbi:MAG TPA: hypothetical protein VD908_05775 [Cytophagales bacterium]|nr:hypothetical protein [Cytophagales bacterium]